VIFIDGGQVESVEAVPNNPMSYISDRQMVEEEDGWPSPDMAGVVNNYDPETEIIVVIKWRGEVGIYRLKSPIAPPTAYESLKSVFSGNHNQSAELIFLDS
jgi:hypothetical protein